ncbi:hypothetical protein Bbelb_127400 [Branchiostoma belcheri]|nr:hypothetical protein Bbelb_127400 [Branchiostoma belcheri]
MNPSLALGWDPELCNVDTFGTCEGNMSRYVVPRGRRRVIRPATAYLPSLPPSSPYELRSNGRFVPLTVKIPPEVGKSNEISPESDDFLAPTRTLIVERADCHMTADDNMAISPDSACYRFLVLFFNCMLTFGSYFCFDMPSVLQDVFQGVRNG